MIESPLTPGRGREKMDEKQMNPAQAADAFRKLMVEQDLHQVSDAGHKMADDFLCDVLRSLGYDDLVALYKSIPMNF